MTLRTSASNQTEARVGSATFGPETRASAWSDLQGRTVDLLVIGGGITGVGIAREAAGRGLDVALVEAGDFAAGTSSRSSRLIHGGLRYLETYDFALVFEALAERGRLLRHAPHLVKPLAFLYPVYAGASVGMLKLRAGMWLYDALAWVHRIRPHRVLRSRAAREHEPKLARDGLRGAALYYDAQVDDARLTVAVARAAQDAGATLVSHARVEGFRRGADGRIGGVEVRDTRTGETIEIAARLVVSAVGPWTDDLRRLLDPDARPLLRPTKGVHLQLPRGRVGNRGAITFRSPLDGRVMFVLPWGEFTYVGTTDTEHAGSADDAEADREDVEYVLRSINAIFPDAELTAADVLSTWTGVRPLLAPRKGSGRLTAGQTSREHEIWRETGGLLCIAGGKLTTFRVMAREAADEASQILKREHGIESGHFDSRDLPLPGAPETEWEEFVQELDSRAGELGIARATVEHLARAYGGDAHAVLDLARDDRALAAPILAPHPYIWAEIPHVVRTEMAMTLEDVLRRRLHLFYDSADGGVAAARAVGERMAREPGIGWSDADLEAEVERYASTVSATRGALRPSPTGGASVQPAVNRPTT